MSNREDTLMQLCATPLHGTGTVLAVATESGLCTVQTRQGALAARRAASCLLAPQAGDRVWLAGDLELGLYVTAILERGNDAAPAQLRLPVDTTIEAPGGALTLRAESLRLDGRRLSAQADEAAFSVRKVSGVGREAVWSFGSIRIVSELLESFADRVVQFARWSQRTVEGMDQVRAGQIDLRAEQMLQLQAQNIVANASNLAKVDGEQIHLG